MARWLKVMLPLICLVAGMFVIYFLTLWSDRDLVSLSFVIGFPFVAGGVFTVFRPRGAFRGLIGLIFWIVLVMVLSLAGSQASGFEGLICIAMAGVPMIGAALLGGVIALTVRRAKVDRKTTTGVYLLPLLAFVALDQLPNAPRIYAISNTVVIDAPAAAVFEFVKEIRDIRPEEIDTRASHLLGVPKPTEALWVEGTEGVVRQSSWGDEVRFLEHITRIEPGRVIEWRFEFPEGWAEGVEDPHLQVGGAYLDILSGGYEIEPMGDKTRLTLTTRSLDRSGFGAYARFWHHFFIEDFHLVILDLVKHRMEAARP
ncbi:SRPBCC family protein [Celeribacter naphthalenivorans]|uniref:polyketide cyclase/dehydrase n=1 Tax=Celeribacter naphthalenivorans TaxID=1614694 RepID=UPI001CFBBF3C|nr:polyketide cyclase/dehydrase [Celeribacter naphthalenivorans]